LGLAPHDCLPAWHLLAGTQLVPSAHITQSPLLQVIPEPQLLP
jgi:hypothetical protein